MKYFIIYKDDKFIGYTDNKVVLKRFLEVRSSKYKVVKMHKDEIPLRIINNDSFESYALAYYNGYKLIDELPLFIYEFSKFESLIREELLTSSIVIKNLIRDIDYIKTDDLYAFKKALEKISDIYHDLITYSYHEPIYDEVFDVFKFFKVVYDKDLIH